MDIAYSSRLTKLIELHVLALSIMVLQVKQHSHKKHIF